jgi:hypothetical protein
MQSPQAECQICGKPFNRQRMGQKVCGYQCAKKVPARARKARREALKPRAKWLDEAQKVVNKYVRLRDKDLPCVSCDRPASWGGQWHASHFRSVGAASAVRFHLWNIHKACSICNNWKSGNLSEYEPRLAERIGTEKIAWLKAQNKVISYDINYLKRLKLVFQKRANRLETRHEQS